MGALSIGLLAGCGIEKNTEATLEEVRTSNAKQEKLVEATIRMEALTKELLGVSKELAKLTGQLQESTRETNASVGRSNEMQSQLLELTKKLAALTETLGARTESVEGNTQRLQSLMEDLLALTKQLAEVTAKMSAQMAAVEGNTEDLEILTQEVARLINRLVQGMDLTNQGVRLQILTVAMQQMLSPEATESLAPPARIFPYAATFAREATAMETLEIFHTFLQDTLYGGVNEGATRDRGRKVSLTIASAIAAFTPHDKLREILSTQVESPGRYIDSARALAACRYVFIRDYLFYSATAAETVNVATLRAAVEYYRQLRYLTEVPYAGTLKFQIMGLGGEDMEIQVNPDEMASLGLGAARRFEAELPPEVLKTAEVRALLSELTRQRTEPRFCGQSGINFHVSSMPPKPPSLCVLGDSLALLRRLPTGVFDHCIADPPYNMSKSRGLGWAFSKHVTMQESWDRFTPEQYLDFTRQWLGEVRRVVKENGNLFLFGTYHNIYTLGFLIQRMDLKILNSIIWVKPNAQPNITCRMLTESSEQLIWACNAQGKRAKGWYFDYRLAKELNGGKQMRNVWEYPLTPRSERLAGHPTQKPVRLIRRIVQIASREGDCILDPFAGVGTTGAAALAENRRFFLIERSPQYFEAQKARFRNASDRVEFLPAEEWDRWRGARLWSPTAGTPRVDAAATR